MSFKKIVCLLLVALPFIGFAQKELKITEQEKDMSMGARNAYVVDIPQAKAKDVISDFKKYIKKDAKGKLNDDKGEISMLGAVNKNVSSMPFNVFGRFVESSEGVTVSIWVADGETFVSSKLTPDKSVAASKYLKDFAVEQYKQAVKEEFEKEKDKAKAEQKMLESFIKDQKKAESNIEDHKAEIANREKKIKEEESNIGTAKINQEKQKDVIAKQNTVLNTVQQKLNNIR
jgi:hypothetical protein